MSEVTCSHIGSQHATLSDIEKLSNINSCANCDYAGRNLWICIQRNCLRVGCSEKVNDHSTEHYQLNKTHCLHMHMSSKRIWCYMCEVEVVIANEKSQNREPFIPSMQTLFRSNDIENDSLAATIGLVGLQNIANTCYMNSALQALSNVQPMTNYFLDCGELVEHTVMQLAIAPKCKAGLAKSYHRLIQDIWCRSNADKVFITPRNILCGIRSVHPMFRGFQQHDTQEFLRCFMDQLHEELKELSPTSPFSYDVKHKICEKHNDSAITEEDNSLSEYSESSYSSSLSLSDYETCDSSVSDLSNSPIGHLHSKNKENAVLQASGFSELEQDSISKPPSSSTIRSIISDVFDGKLLSSVQCLTCDRISAREETFQDLSLPIPNRDYLNVLHQTRSLSTQSLNSLELSTIRDNESWFSWIWKWLRSWIWGPSITLYDCMASFFSADELKGDNMYSCEKCNKLRTGVKYSQILDLPEVLCIHLKRFRHDLSYSSKISSHVEFPLEGFDMTPYLHRDCKSKVVHYNLSSVICHHGTVGGGHYTCFARNALNNRWYDFDDHHVTEVSSDIVENCQAYVLFYHKYNAQMELVRTAARDLATINPVHLADIRFYIAREWLSRFNTFAEPGPINNWAILCPHGGLLQSKIAIINQIAVPISQPLWDFLYYKFGGGPAINMLFECDVCKRASEALARRQKFESSVFTKYKEEIDEEGDSSPIYAISMPWLRKWQQFIRGGTSKEPGPIVNGPIMPTIEEPQSSSPIRNVRPGSDYAQLNAPTWRFLYGIYGGGPEIILRGSPAEEIIIIDQDEYCSDNYHVHRDLSDTESNIGQNSNTPDMDIAKPLLERTVNDLIINDEKSEMYQPTKPILNTIKDPKYNKYLATNYKKSKSAVAFRNSFRKKTKKSRNALKNNDLFGLKGNYNLHNHSNNCMDNVDLNAFKKHSKQSFQYKKNKKKGFKIAEDSINGLSEEIFFSHFSHSSNNSKVNGSVTLQKFSQLPECNDSHETKA